MKTFDEFRAIPRMQHGALLSLDQQAQKDASAYAGWLHQQGLSETDIRSRLESDPQTSQFADKAITAYQNHFRQPSPPQQSQVPGELMRARQQQQFNPFQQQQFNPFQQQQFNPFQQQQFNPFQQQQFNPFQQQFNPFQQQFNPFQQQFNPFQQQQFNPFQQQQFNPFQQQQPFFNPAVFQQGIASMMPFAHSNAFGGMSLPSQHMMQMRGLMPQGHFGGGFGGGQFMPQGGFGGMQGGFGGMQGGFGGGQPMGQLGSHGDILRGASSGPTPVSGLAPMSGLGNPASGSMSGSGGGGFGFG